MMIFLIWLYFWGAMSCALICSMEQKWHWSTIVFCSLIWPLHVPFAFFLAFFMWSMGWGKR